MHYEIYIDSLFFLNFMLDLMILLLMNKIVKCTATHLSLIMAAAFGAGMVCIIMIVPGTDLVLKLIGMYILLPAGMLKIAFKISGIRALVRAQMLLYTLAFIIGGFIQWLAMNIPFFRKNGLKMAEVIIMGYMAFLLISYAYRKWKRGRSEFVDVILYNDGETHKVTALIDTGNGLTEPVSGKPVSVVEKQCVGNLDKIKESASYCIIPYHSIGREHGIMEGVRIPKMMILRGERNITIENAVLGISEGSISGSGNYQMILNPRLLEE